MVRAREQKRHCPGCGKLTGLYSAVCRTCWLNLQAKRGSWRAQQELHEYYRNGKSPDFERRLALLLRDPPPLPGSV